MSCVLQPQVEKRLFKEDSFVSVQQLMMNFDRGGDFIRGSSPLGLGFFSAPPSDDEGAGEDGRESICSVSLLDMDILDEQKSPEEEADKIQACKRKDPDANEEDECERDESPSMSVRRTKKPKGTPKRAMSPKAVFFHLEMAKMGLGSDMMAGFEGFENKIGKKWNALSSEERRQFEDLSFEDVYRYRKQLEAYHEECQKKKPPGSERTSSPPGPPNLGSLQPFPPLPPGLVPSPVPPPSSCCSAAAATTPGAAGAGAGAGAGDETTTTTTGGGGEGGAGGADRVDAGPTPKTTSGSATGGSSAYPPLLSSYPPPPGTRRTTRTSGFPPQTGTTLATPGSRSGGPGGITKSSSVQTSPQIRGALPRNVEEPAAGGGGGGGGIHSFAERIRTPPGVAEMTTSFVPHLGGRSYDDRDGLFHRLPSAASYYGGRAERRIRREGRTTTLPSPPPPAPPPVTLLPRSAYASSSPPCPPYYGSTPEYYRSNPGQEQGGGAGERCPPQQPYPPCIIVPPNLLRGGPAPSHAASPFGAGAAHRRPPPPPPPSSLYFQQEEQRSGDDASFPILPSGMEIVIPDKDGHERKYKVQYALVTMPRHAAEQYMEQLSALSPRPAELPSMTNIIGGADTTTTSTFDPTRGQQGGSYHHPRRPRGGSWGGRIGRAG